MTRPLSTGNWEICRSPAKVRERVTGWRRNGLSVGLVPTMGALHRGHLALIDRLKPLCDRTVVSIFVNPKQFNDPADLAAYPRQEQRDAEAALGHGAALIYAPPVDAMYPAGFATSIHVSGLTDELEGAHRPGHFDGVTTVVGKLLLQVLPDAAVFGEKDYQQLQVIRRMATDLNLPTDIIAAETVREPDGLALSSRNQLLNAEHRPIAAMLNQVLAETAAKARAGAPLISLAAEAEARLIDAGFEAVDYVTFRDAETLAPVTALDGPVRLLATARLSGVRLLDNMAV